MEGVWTVGAFKELLEGGRFMAGDGAFGTQLIARGMQPGDVPELWNVERAKDVEEIHRLYVEAGACCIETNTFGGNALTLGRHHMADRVVELNKAGVEAAKRAVAGTKTLVAGSIGPTGVLLEPMGEGKPDEMRQAYAEQAKAIAEAGADVLFVETMTSLDEAILAIEGAKEAGLDIVATMTFNKTKRGFFTIMGDNIPTCVKRLVEAGACAVGSNCGNGTEVMTEVARAFKEVATVPLVFQSNAGLPKIVDGESVYTEGPEYLEAFARNLVEIGVSYIGGCCGTSFEHISSIAKVVAEKNG